MSELEQYCILARAQKGRACAALVQQVLSHRKIFVFGELLTIPSVKSLENSEFSKEYSSLFLFAFGTFQDYQANPANYLELSEAQIVKLRQLSLLTLAANCSLLPYSTMHAALGISSVRDLEDFLIEAIYAGLLDGKLDQMNACLRVSRVFSRDVQPASIPSIVNQLSDWSSKIALASQSLQNSNAFLQQNRSLLEAEQRDAQQAVDQRAAAVLERMDLGDDPGEMDYPSIRARMPAAVPIRSRIVRMFTGV